MFTGIIKNIAEISNIKKKGSNLILGFKSEVSKSLKINQSISHNGVCLSVTKKGLDEYFVTVVDETINRTNFRYLKLGDKINLEESINLGSLLDGHLLQGHVDNVAKCKNIKENRGSHIFTFEMESINEGLVVEKGSIGINGVSLTVFDVEEKEKNNFIFSVSIIPYTLKKTNFVSLKEGDYVNIEFDIIGKYCSRLVKKYISK